MLPIPKRKEDPPEVIAEIKVLEENARRRAEEREAEGFIQIQTSYLPNVLPLPPPPPKTGTLQTSKRRGIFIHDVVHDLIPCLQLNDVLLLNETNRRVLWVPTQRAMDRIKPRRFIGPLRINVSGIHREREHNGSLILEPLRFPQIPPPVDKILGFGRITINLYNVDVELMEKISEFLHLCSGRLCQHDLQLKGYQMSPIFKHGMANSVFPPLFQGVRVIEMHLYEGNLDLFNYQMYSSTNRILFAPPFGMPVPTPRDFQNWIDWLHLPTTSNESHRTLIFYNRYRVNVENLISMIKRRFERYEYNGAGYLPKFSVIIFSPRTEHLAPFHLCNIEMGDALRLEKFQNGMGQQPLMEMFAMDDGLKSQFECGRFEGDYGLARALSEDLQHPDKHGCILRRDVAVGPWMRPELFEARRQRSVPEEHKLLRFEWPDV